MGQRARTCKGYSLQESRRRQPAHLIVSYLDSNRDGIPLASEQQARVDRHRRVDRRLLVYGTNETPLEGEDYTSRWNSFLLSGHAVFDQMILDRVFATRDGKIFHSGALLLALGYARPMHFIPRYLETGSGVYKVNC